jgi:hypothetical protein
MLGSLCRCRRDARSGELRRSVSWSRSTRKASPDGGGRLWGERIEPTEEWAELEPRLQWPEQVNYELIRPPLLSDVSVA